jgi:GDP-4-dehydro-6-deoxy-D-mannose reductase
MGSRVLITGCEGFIGSHLAEYLIELGLTVYGMVYQNTGNLDHLADKLSVREANIEDREKVHRLLVEARPDFVFHLAAQSLILPSWQNPGKTFEINVIGTVNLLDEVKNLELDPVIIVAGSSAEYVGSQDESIIKESTELRPTSPYGVSKLVQDMLAELYWKNHKLRTIRIRPFLIVGPRKVLDACSDFARGIAEVEAGQRENISVGNLEAIRDLLDVKDAVKAMWLLAKIGTPGEVYNICSGKGYRMRDILDELLSMSSHKIAISSDPTRMRPSDTPVIIGDNSRLRGLGWEVETPIETTLVHILSYWRNQVGKRNDRCS